jgi:hypothetical protein
MRFRVSVTPRDGFLTKVRAGRFWPRGNGTQTMDVHDSENDPIPANPKDEQWQLGQRSFRELKADPEIRILPDGDPVDVARVTSENEELRARVAELEAENGLARDAMKELVALREEALGRCHALEGDLATAASRVAELEAQVAALASTNAGLASKIAEASERKKGR